MPLELKLIISTAQTNLSKTFSYIMTCYITKFSG